MKKIYKDTLYDIQMKTLRVLSAHYGVDLIPSATVERMLALYKEDIRPDGWIAFPEGENELAVYPIWNERIDYDTVYIFRFPSQWKWKDNIPTFFWWE